MTTDTFSNTFEGVTDVQFRDWVTRFSQALVTCGLVQTADTGQINKTTTARPSVTGNAETFAGFEIFRFSDALQATKPVFVKVEYGTYYAAISGATPAASPAIYVTVGTATNGAGVLTGTLVTARTRLVGATGMANVSGPSVTSTTASATSPCFFSGDGSYINIALGVTASSQAVWYTCDNSGFTGRRTFPAFLCIERTRNGDGLANGDGVMLATANWATSTSAEATSPTTRYQIVSFTAGFTVSPQDVGWPITWPGQGFGTANFGGDLYFFPMLGATPKPQFQFLGFLGTFKNDVPLANQQTVTVLGVLRTYLSLAGIAGVVAADNARSFVNVTTPLGGLMMRYE